MNTEAACGLRDQTERLRDRTKHVTLLQVSSKTIQPLMANDLLRSVTAVTCSRRCGQRSATLNITN